MYIGYKSFVFSWCIFSLLLGIWFIRRKQFFAVTTEFFSATYCKPHLGEMIYQGFVVCFFLGEIPDYCLITTFTSVVESSEFIGY